MEHAQSGHQCAEDVEHVWAPVGSLRAQSHGLVDDDGPCEAAGVEPDNHHQDEEAACKVLVVGLCPDLDEDQREVAQVVEEVDLGGLLVEVEHVGGEEQEEGDEVVQAHLDEVFLAPLEQDGEQSLEVVAGCDAPVRDQLRVLGPVGVWVAIERLGKCGGIAAVEIVQEGCVFHDGVAPCNGERKVQCLVD